MPGEDRPRTGSGRIIEPCDQDKRHRREAAVQGSTPLGRPLEEHLRAALDREGRAGRAGLDHDEGLVSSSRRTRRSVLQVSMTDLADVGGV